MGTSFVRHVGQFEINIMIVYHSFPKVVNLCYNVYMCENNEMCYFCDKKSEYTQPEKNTGQIISVCPTHFSYRYMG